MSSLQCIYFLCPSLDICNNIYPLGVNIFTPLPLLRCLFCGKINIIMVEFTYKEEQDIIWDTLDEMWPSGQELEPTTLPDEVDKFIIDKIKDALIECNYNHTHTAKKLGIKRETLLAKLKKFKL